jgi:hypothetical protein
MTDEEIRSGFTNLAKNYREAEEARKKAVETLRGLLSATRKAHSHAQNSLGYADNEAHFVGEWMDAAREVLKATPC